jgi:hypothetical protein
MIENVRFENYKCFKKASLTDCRRINILLGANASGKTSLLEGMFLASGGSPELAVRTRQMRGVEQNFFAAPVGMDYLFSDLFYNFDRTKDISLTLTGSTNITRSLNVRYTGEVSLVVPNHNTPTPATMPAPLSFEWTIANGKTQCTPMIGQGGFVTFSASAKVDIETYFFSASMQFSSAENANRFSNLSQRFAEKRIVEIFLDEFPELSGLSVEIFNGVPAVAAIKAGMERKLPLTLISGGMNKFLAILTCLQYAQGTTLFIDEIENGFYYKRFEPTWKAIHALAIETKGQLFASTHSRECLEAAYTVAKEYPDDFSFIHLGREEVKQFDGQNFVFAVEEGIEIR